MTTAAQGVSTFLISIHPPTSKDINPKTTVVINELGLGARRTPVGNNVPVLKVYAISRTRPQ